MVDGGVTSLLSTIEASPKVLPTRLRPFAALASFGFNDNAAAVATAVGVAEYAYRKMAPFLRSLGGPSPR